VVVVGDVFLRGWWGMLICVGGDGESASQGCAWGVHVVSLAWSSLALAFPCQTRALQALAGRHKVVLVSTPSGARQAAVTFSSPQEVSPVVGSQRASLVLILRE